MDSRRFTALTRGTTCMAFRVVSTPITILARENGCRSQVAASRGGITAADDGTIGGIASHFGPTGFSRCGRAAVLKGGTASMAGFFSAMQNSGSAVFGPAVGGREVLITRCGGGHATALGQVLTTTVTVSTAKEGLSTRPITARSYFSVTQNSSALRRRRKKRGLGRLLALLRLLGRASSGCPAIICRASGHVRCRGAIDCAARRRGSRSTRRTRDAASGRFFGRAPICQKPVLAVLCAVISTVAGGHSSLIHHDCR